MVVVVVGCPGSRWECSCPGEPPPGPPPAQAGVFPLEFLPDCVVRVWSCPVSSHSRPLPVMTQVCGRSTHLTLGHADEMAALVGSDGLCERRWVSQSWHTWEKSGGEGVGTQLPTGLTPSLRWSLPSGCWRTVARWPSSVSPGPTNRLEGAPKNWPVSKHKVCKEPPGKSQGLRASASLSLIPPRYSQRQACP